MSNIVRHTGRIDFDLIRTLPAHPFDYTYLMGMLKPYRSPRDKISRMLKNGEIMQLKRGLYILSPKFGGEIDRGVIANLIYGPSYVSLEYALSFWGLIPERVQEVTCMTNKRNKYFRTPLGAFSYKYISNTRFSPGVILIDSEAPIRRTGEQGVSYFIATKEKALCDKLATVREIRGEHDITDYLRFDLRIDLETMADLNMPVLNKIMNAYNNRAVTALFNWAGRIIREDKKD